MANRRRPKAKHDLKKGREGDKNAIQKLIDNAQRTSSNAKGSACVENAPKVPRIVGSMGRSEISRHALSLIKSNTFSQTVKPLVPTPPKRRPDVKLGQSNAFRSEAYEPNARTSSELRKYINSQVKPPKLVVPGLSQDSRCRDPDFLIKDQRHENGGLVFLPKEPDIKRTPLFVRDGHFRFLDLPAEIRNQIYGYLIEPECYTIKWDGEGRRGHQLTHRLPKRSNACQPRLSQSTRQRRLDLKKSPRCVGRELLMKDLYSDCSPVALSWVCRKMYGEASSMLYSRSTFIFDGIGPLRHFMDTVTSQNKASITTLKLVYKAYGQPSRTENRIWKAKADRAWEDLCWRISYECPAVNHLVLDLDYGYSKLQFVPFFELDSRTFGTTWRAPLWAFEGLDLRSCICRLRSATTSEAVLEVESYNIRRALLGDAWDEAAEEGNDVFGCKKRQQDNQQRRAVGVLRTTRSGEVFGLA